MTKKVLLFIQKGDITEELDRLDSHIHELRRLLNLSEPVGKKIDFLMQEFNREANTLGSKSISVEISEEELTKRKNSWIKPELKFKSGILHKYCKNVSNASNGCVTDEINQ